MDDWLSQLLSGAIGLVSGIASGFYFERRQTRMARDDAALLRADNDRLEAMVTELRERMSGLNTNVTTHLAGTSSGGSATPARDGSAELAPEIMRFIQLRLDASGAVPRADVFEHFYRDHSAEVVDAGIATLVSQGKVVADRRTVRIKL